MTKFERDFYSLMFDFKDDNMIEVYKAYFEEKKMYLNVKNLIEFYFEHNHDISYLKTFIEDFSFFKKYQ